MIGEHDGSILIEIARMQQPRVAPIHSAGRARSRWARPTIGAVGILVRLTDLGIVILTAPVALWMAPGTVGASSLLGFVVVCAGLMQLDLFRAVGLYRAHVLGSVRGQLWRVALAWGAIVVLLMLLGSALAGTSELPPSFFQAWLAVALAVLLPLHAGVALSVRHARAHGRLSTQLVLVGAGPQAAHFVQHVKEHNPAVRVLGIFDDRRTRVAGAVEGCPVLGSLDDLFPFARARHVDQVVIALPHHAASRRLACLEKLRHLPIDVRLSPDLPGLELGAKGLVDIAGLPVLRVFDRPLAGWAGLVKAIEDRALALMLLIALGPLLLLIALLIRLDSSGPVLYRQQRYGFDNRPIPVLKFRTMYLDRCDLDDRVQPARRYDPRVTPLGRILRRTSLDELPQLLNVLRGDMSIVGPRPHASAQNEHFAALIDGYLARHRVKPGITGWAQVHGLRGEVDTLAKMQERVRYDLHYIENWSLGLDLRIILRTLLVGFSHPNAY